MFLNLRSRLSQFLVLGTRRKCYLAVSPDPKYFRPLKLNPDLGGHESYILKFGDGPSERILKYVTDNPNYGFGHNDGTERHGKALEKASLQPVASYSALQHNHKRSEWWYVESNGQKDSQGRDLQGVLVALLEEFPNYELDSEEGLITAAKKIRSQIEAVSIIRPADPRASFDTLATHSVTDD